MATHSGILAWRIPMDRGAWWAIVHSVTKSQTRLSNFTFFLSLMWKMLVCHQCYVGTKWMGLARRAGLLLFLALTELSHMSGILVLLHRLSLSS